MCYISMVMEDFTKRDEWQLIPNQLPFVPNFIPNPGNQSVIITSLTKQDIDKLEKLIAEFKEAVVLANRLDVLVKKPDCIDPEKAKLITRVAELEEQLNKIKGIIKVPDYSGDPP